MPRKIDQRIADRILLLRRKGYRLGEIMTSLKKELLRQGIQIPAESTVSRHLKRIDATPPGELSEDEPFAWGTLRGMPWEASHLVLAVESYWHDRRLEENRGALTFRVAKWTWRVANALGAVNQIDEDRLFSSSSAPEEDELEASPNVPNEVDILDFAQEYALREMVFEVLEQPFVTKDLDLLLASTPWESLNRLTAYRSRRNALRIKHVEWHDPYRDWEDLGPDEIRKKLAGLRDRFRSEDRLASEGFRAAIEQLNTQTDGLLASQISRFTEYSNDLQGVPWWVNHLHETYSAWLKKHDDISFNI